MRKTTFATIILILFGEPSFAENSEKNYYVRSKGYSSNPESDPPHYVKQLNQTEFKSFKNIDWIDAGLNYRMRLEHRDNDFRRSVNQIDNPILSRTQAYFGIKNIIDPLRFAIELQDSREHNSKFVRQTRDVNRLDLLQGYGELYFKNPTAINRPITIRGGRMAFEVLDRKLFSRDDWGNTITNFQGFRATIGAKENDWQFDSFALQPMIKLTDEIDRRNKNQWFYGAILNWRKWSDIATLQPFYLKMDQEESAISEKREINSPGLRLYGTFGDSGFDYDLIGVHQFGESRGKTHRASAYATEIGYTHTHEWKPRLSLIYAYASGDKNPNDGKNQRFERFYGLNRVWSNSNHIEWENIETIKSRIELQPHKKLRMEGSYSFYWLASSSDSLELANLQDKTATSGDSIGHDFDFRTHYEITKNLRTTLGFAHFRPGKFTKNVSRDSSSDFTYLELTWSLF
jgi:hypothetical protein